MSHCCGDDSDCQEHRSSRPSAALGILRRWLWLVVVLLVIAVAAVWFTWGPGKNMNQASVSAAPATERVEGPRIQFDETYFDFGQVPVDTFVEHTFTYRNIGTQPLVLEKQVLATAEEGC